MLDLTVETVATTIGYAVLTETNLSFGFFVK